MNNVPAAEAGPQASGVAEAPPARIRLRLRAFVLDYVLFLGYAVVLGVVALLFPATVQAWFTISAASAQAAGFALLTLPVILYFSITESSARQASWGKQRLGLRVVDRHGGRIGLGRALVRAAVKFLPWELGHFTVWQFREAGGDPPGYVMPLAILAQVLVVVYVTLPLFNSARRSVYDFVAGTRVDVTNIDEIPNGTQKTL